MVSNFSRKVFFQILLISYFSISCEGAQKSGDEKLVTRYDTNLKLASIMSFWVYHCKRKEDDKIRHQISIKTFFVDDCIIGSKLAVQYAKYSRIIIMITTIIIKPILIVIMILIILTKMLIIITIITVKVTKMVMIAIKNVTS